jgi:hypothetical protein
MNSIGDFAESLILGNVEDIKKGKSLPPKLEEAKTASSGAPAKDVSQIKVPDEMMQQILGEGFHPQDTPPAEGIPELVWEQPEEEATTPEPSYLTEETGQQLVSLLEEVKGLVDDLKEMTTCGMIGTNMAGPVADPMKNSAKGYRKPTRSSVLKNSIRRKLR